MQRSSRRIPFEALDTADLIVDAVYEGGPNNTWGDDPIGKLLPVGNQGGFRASGSSDPFELSMVVLYSTGRNVDWPDFLDLHTGQFVYFGDNKKPGHELHDTPRKGNEILRTSFERLHAGRFDIPPFFIFESTGEGRSVRFRGLAVPGAPNIGPDDDLVAVWRTTDNERFQNYRAIFTVLDENEISREWINDITEGNPITRRTPSAWGYWASSGRYGVESLLHEFFADARMDIWFEMGDGRYKDATEWFDLPLFLIDEAIELISAETLPNFRYDAGKQAIILVDR